jgi:hypothetical protein
MATMPIGSRFHTNNATANARMRKQVVLGDRTGLANMSTV